MPLNQKQRDALFAKAEERNAVFPVALDLTVAGEKIYGFLHADGTFEETGKPPEERPMESNA